MSDLYSKSMVTPCCNTPFSVLDNYYYIGYYIYIKNS